MGMYKVLRLTKKVIGGDSKYGFYDVYKVEKEYDDYDTMLADLPKYKDKIGKGYLVVQELVVTDDLEIEAPEVVAGDVKPVPDNEVEQLYTDTYNKVFGVNP